MPIELLPEMNVNDFKYLLFNHCGVKKGLGFTKLFQAKDKDGTPMFTTDKSGRQYPVTTSIKQENVKRFMKENPQFKDMLMKMPNADKDYVEYLCRKMSLFGLTDMSKELERHPEWANQPAIDVHHIINVKDCRLLEEQGKSFTAVNDYENMCIVSNGTLWDALNRANRMESETKSPSVHAGIHSADTIFKNQKENGDIKRTMVRLEPKPGTRCMLGFGEDMIIRDQSQQAQEQFNDKNRQIMYAVKQNEAIRA